MKRAPILLLAFLAGWCGSLLNPVSAQVAVRLARLRDLPEYRGTSQIVLNKVPAASATKAVLMMGTTGALSGGSASGTYLGINTAAGYAGDLANYQVDGTTVYRINAAGNVGIGTTPITPIHISSSGGGFTLDRIVTSANAPSLQLRKARGTVGAETTIATSDGLGQVIFGGYDGTAYRNTATIQTFSDGAVGLNSIPTRMVFSTAQAAGTSIRLNLDSLGNVVIGAAVLATTATDGFLYVPTCAGVPTGVPTAYSGRAPMIWDSTNHNLYCNDAAGWTKVD